MVVVCPIILDGFVFFQTSGDVALLRLYTYHFLWDKPLVLRHINFKGCQGVRASCSLVTTSEQDGCPYGHTALTHEDYSHSALRFPITISPSLPHSLTLHR